MKLLDHLKLSLRSIWSNVLRTLLTMMIIVIGITALVGILTSVDAIKAGLGSTFSLLGANSFSIVRKGDGLKVGHPRRSKEKKAPEITLDQALSFKDKFEFPSYTSISTIATPFGLVKAQGNKTNPNILIQAVDENYIQVRGEEIEFGRNFSVPEIIEGKPVCILGKAIAKTLFNKADRALNKWVSINNRKYLTIGILKSKGSSGVFNSDNSCLISLINAKTNFGNPATSYNLEIATMESEFLDFSATEAEGAFRTVRGLGASDEADFEIMKSDKLALLLIDNLYYVEWAAIVIGFITLFGAGIGLMNIMLVTVSERTREIGISKAIGARNSTILTQYLMESVVICLIGGMIGIFFGIICGNLVSAQVNGPFFIPWNWLIGGVIFCLIIGCLAGLYPAIKAAGLDPIESLRHE